MDTTTTVTTFDNISQRVLFSYIRSLAQPASDAGPERRDLHAFLHALYQAMFAQPQAFGLPLTEDAPVLDEEPERTKKLAVVNRLLDVPRKRTAQVLDFLRAAALAGTLNDQTLAIAAQDYAGLLKASKIQRKALQALAGVGLEIQPSGENVILSSSRFPAMLAALQELARACAGYQPENLARFHFARCDFRAAQPGYLPDPLDLYRIFDAPAHERLAGLHAYLSSKGYKTIHAIYGTSAWEIKYQGNRKIKGTPLFQVEYQERCANPLRLHIKCASATRIADLMPKQPRQLQEDFFRRAYRCQGEKCGWCKNRKGLGPSLLEYEDTRVSICWYVNPDIFELTDSTVALIKQYIELHESLGSPN